MADIDYGEDLSCVRDLNGICNVVSGQRLLAEAIARRLITPRGRLIGDPNYGTDITDIINADMNKRDIANLTVAIRAECLKDQRVASATVQIVAPPNLTGKYTITIGIQSAVGPFTMTVAVNDVTLELLQVA